MRPGCQASRLAVWRRERSDLDYAPRPADVGPGGSIWKRWWRTIRLRCIRTSPDPPSMRRFVADCKGGLTAAPSGRCAGHRTENDHLEEAHRDGFTGGELTGLWWRPSLRVTATPTHAATTAVGCQARCRK